jgi:hypothetical protein
MGNQPKPSKGQQTNQLIDWYKAAEKDVEYTQLAGRAILGEQDAIDELQYRFPWIDHGPAQRWAEIPSPAVQELVYTALNPQPDTRDIPYLRWTAQTRCTIEAAQDWNQHQTNLLLQLAEASCE